MNIHFSFIMNPMLCHDSFALAGQSGELPVVDGSTVGQLISWSSTDYQLYFHDAEVLRWHSRGLYIS